MEPKNSDKTEQKRKAVTAGVVALAVVSLLAGASVSATLEEYAAPKYAESDPFEGAVDDVTGEDTWEEKESDENPMSKHIRKAMKDRMDDRSEDRTEHLEKRIQIDTNLIAAFQFCIESADCTSDNDPLSEMIEKLTWAVEGMQSELDGTDEAEKDDYSDTEDSSQEVCEEADGTWKIDDRKGGYCVSDIDFKDWDERKDWDESDKVEFAEEKFTQLRAAQVAISFCIDSDGCSADSEVIETALGHMLARAEHHRECADDRRCDRDHDHRKGFRGRMHAAICKMTDRCDDRGEGGDTLIDRPEIVITQEVCESRMGIWTEATDRGEGVFYCDWGEQSDDPGSEDESGERDREDESSSPDNREECESSGGTWYEDRQYCHTE